MSKKEYEDTVRYYGFNLVVYPAILCFGIYLTGAFIEILFNLELGVAKQIFAGIGGVGYFVWYFKNKLKK